MSEQWPPDYQAEYVRRLKLNKSLKEDTHLRAAFMLHYRDNPIDWINDWCTTLDPRKVSPEPRLMPFILFNRQRELVRFLHECLIDKENGLIEKCRDAGASWVCVSFATWLWLFHPESVIGFGSRKEEYVDKKGDPKALLPKIRQIIEYLPNWMLPPSFEMDKNAPFMRIMNPNNGAIITGEAGDAIGRGSRSSIFIKDESSHYEHAELIEAALGDNTDVQIDVSSVNGSNNVFYRRRMAGEVWYPDKKPAKGKVRVFIFDWRDHPGKTQEWYDARRTKAESEGLLHIFAQEVDRDYAGSVDKVIIKSEWVRAAIDAHITLNFTAQGKKIAAQDVADGGGDKNALACRHGVVLQFVDHWGGEAQEAAKKAVPICMEHQISELYYDCIGVGAGFKAQINTMKENGAISVNMNVMPWDAASSPIDPEGRVIVGDNSSPKNIDQFANLKAQAWWNMRTRFYKTFRAIRFGEKYNPDELVSLPSTIQYLREIEMELSQATYEYSGSGKMLVDKKPKGASSPNLADAIIMCYTPQRKPRGFFDI